MRPFTVVHPASCEFVPAGGRYARFALVRTETPVEIREHAAGAYESVPWPEEAGPSATALRDEDGYWTPILRGGRVFWGGPALSADELAVFLASDGAVAGAGDRFAPLACALAMTPILARGREGIDSAFLPTDLKPREQAATYASGTRGLPVDLDRARELRRDDRAAASDRLRAWVAANLRLVGGVPHLRQVPLAGIVRDRPDTADGPRSWRVLDTPRLAPVNVPLATPSGWADLHAGRVSNRGAIGGSESLAGWLDLAEGIPPDASGRQVANAGAHLARAYLDRLIARAGREGVGNGRYLDEARAAQAQMREAEILAYTGSFGENSVADALRALLRGLDAVWELPRELGIDREAMPGQFALAVEIRQHHLPRAESLDPGDATALDDLRAPGMTR